MTVALLIATALVVVTNASASIHLSQAQRAARVPAGATALGASPSGTQQSGELALKPRDPAALASYISDLTTRQSAGFHDYLKPGQFASEFGPTQATIAAVTSDLASDGLTVTSVSSSGMLISFRGSTAQVESAFGTSVERYRTAAGVTGEETPSAIELPSDISADVSGVVGLNTLYHPATSLVTASAANAAAVNAATKAATPPTVAGAPSPGANDCTAAGQTASTFGGLTDDEIANTYGAFGEYAAGDFGAGVRIGVYELEPYARSDIQTFDECYFGVTTGLQMVNDQLVPIPVDGGQSSGAGSGEAALDIEDISAMAPGADIDVYEAPNTNAGALDEYTQMIDDDQDQIISTSWGECEQELEAYEPGVQESEFYLFEQAAAQGQTVVAATGDTGSDGCNVTRSDPPAANQNPLSVWDPASQPDVVSVGGTELSDADPTDEAETTWNDDGSVGGGGGGISNAWDAPSWQQFAPGFSATDASALSAANSLESADAWPTGFCDATTQAATTCRALPDVSAAADPETGGVTAFSSAFATLSGAVDGGWYQVGGTSSAAPIWAAMLALVDGSSTCADNNLAPGNDGNGNQTGGIGFAAPLLYADANSATGDDNADFDDILADPDNTALSNSNDIYNLDGGKTFPVGTGYDLATGLGSPRLTLNGTGTQGGLAADLCDLAESGASAVPVVTSFEDASGNPVTAGPTSGGTILNIEGSNFRLSSSLKVKSVTVGGDVIAPNQTMGSVTSTSVTVTLPSASATLPANASGVLDGAGPVQIIVTLSNGASSAATAASTYDYVDEDASGTALPTVSSVGPYAGSESGTPSPVTIYGAGFDPTGDTVDFGGVASSGYTYVSSSEIQATPPAYASGPTCATASKLVADYGHADGFSTPAQASAQDICQTQVQVVNAGGETATPASQIEPLAESSSTGADASEPYPQPTEFDYVPTPTITSVSTTTPSRYASSYGDTIVQLTGTGLNAAALDWVNFGDPNQASSQDTDITAEGGTYIDVEAPALATTPGPATTPIPVSVNSVIGLSTSQDATYAGIPQISAIAVSGTGTGTAAYAGATGYSIAPDGGGSSLTVSGAGLSDANQVSFIDASNSSARALAPSITDNGDDQLLTLTAAVSPSIQDVQVCTASACTTTIASALQLLQYAPGNPAISALSTTSGPAAGGTSVTITGQNLGCATEVSFGAAPAQSVANGANGTACGSATSVTAVAPAGTAGATVPVTVVTAATIGDGFTTSSETGGSFTYNAVPVTTVTNTVTTPGPTTTVTTPSPTTTVTNTVTAPGATSTVTTPGPTTTVTAPGTSTTTIETYNCTTVTKDKTETVTKKVKVTVKGKPTTKLEKVKEKVPYKVQSCALVKKTTTVKNAERLRRAAERRLASALAAEARAAETRARGARAAAQQAARARTTDR